MALDRTNLLNTMASQAPLQQKQATTSMGAASQASMRQQVAQAPGPLTTAQQQQAGAQQAATMGSQRLQAAQQGIQQQAQIGQMGLQQQAQQSKEKLAERQLGLRTKQRNLENQLASMGEQVKQKLFDSNMTFQRDELGRTAWNERQLADWVVKKAKSVEDLRNYQMKVAQISKRKMQYLKTAQQKLTQALEQASTDKMQALDQASRERIARAKIEIERQLREEADAAASRGAMGAGAGGIIGTVVGAYVGGPTGAQIGGQAGSAIGQGASTIKSPF